MDSTNNKKYDKNMSKKMLTSEEEHVFQAALKKTK